MKSEKKKRQIVVDKTRREKKGRQTAKRRSTVEGKDLGGRMSTVVRKKRKGFVLDDGKYPEKMERIESS